MKLATLVVLAVGALAAGPVLADAWVRNRASVRLIKFVNASEQRPLELPSSPELCRTAFKSRRPHWCDISTENPSGWPAIVATETLVRNLDPAGRRVDTVTAHLSPGTGPTTVDAADAIDAGFSFGGAYSLADGSVTLPGFGSGFGFIAVLEQDGCVEVSIRARNGLPPPVRLEVVLGSNHWLLEFDRGNDEWAEARAIGTLPRGRHTGRVRFMNDLFDPVHRVDRNGIVDHLTVELIDPGACRGASANP